MYLPLWDSCIFGLAWKKFIYFYSFHWTYLLSQSNILTPHKIPHKKYMPIIMSLHNANGVTEERKHNSMEHSIHSLVTDKIFISKIQALWWSFKRVSGHGFSVWFNKILSVVRETWPDVSSEGSEMMFSISSPSPLKANSVTSSSASQKRENNQI